MSLVSVVMPTYNAAAWVAATIDNLCTQTYANLELIVVDDGSQDDTVPLVRQKLKQDFKNPWQVVELGANRGPSAARNVGLRAASGSWVQFLDSDDYLAPTKLERQMAHCANAAPDVSAVYSPWRQCYVDDGAITLAGQLSRPDMSGRAPIMCLVGNDRPLHSAGLARRSALDQIGGWDESLRFWECEEVTFRLAKAGRLENVPADGPLYLWRQHRDRVYVGDDNARYGLKSVALSWVEQLLKGLGHKSLDQVGLSASDRRGILEYSSYWARLLFRQDRAAFREYVAAARRLYPDLGPTDPKPISVLARGVGYEAAESVLYLARAPKSLARRILQGLQGRAQEPAFKWD